MNYTPMHAIAIPLIGAFVIGALGTLADQRRSRTLENMREAATIVTAAALLWVVANLVPEAMAYGTEGHEEAKWELLQVLPGVPLAFHVEPLGMIYALIASGLWILNSIYSIGYMRGNNEKKQTRFFICFAVSIASVMGIAFSANMLTLFIFYEALSLATFPLVTHSGTPEAIKSGRTYLGILVGTSICLMLPATIGTWVFAETLDFTPGGVFRDALAAETMEPVVFALFFVMFMYGIGKAAIMPSHRWLPAAMVAPTPVSALLHAVAVVKAGVFTVVKVTVYLIGMDVIRETFIGGFAAGGWLAYMACFTILMGSFIALFQDNLKRRLAYSTISQLSYIVLGAALLYPISAMAAALHIAAHAFGKITLFFAAGSIYTSHHKKYISQLDGIGRRMPITMGAFTIGTLSMIGLPPTAGFISKWYLLQGAWLAEHWVALTTIVLSTLLNAAYFLPIVYRAFFKPLREDDPYKDKGEAPLPIVIALSCTAGLAVLMFFFPELFLGLGQTFAAAIP